MDRWVHMAKNVDNLQELKIVSTLTTSKEMGSAVLELQKIELTKNLNKLGSSCGKE